MNLETCLYRACTKPVTVLFFFLLIRSSIMALPTIVFVHGAWHWPGFFTKVKNILETKGYRTIVLALPSVGRTPPVSSLNEDIFMVRTAVLKELDAGYNVVINAHSKYYREDRSKTSTNNKYRLGRNRSHQLVGWIKQEGARSNRPDHLGHQVDFRLRLRTTGRSQSFRCCRWKGECDVVENQGWFFLQLLRHRILTQAGR